MSDFLLLFRGGKPDAKTFSPEEMQKHMQAWGGWIENLNKDGKFKGGDPLGGEGKVLSGRDKTVTDGPFAEAKDLVGGYLLITADSLDAATEMSRGCPIFETDGSVEVREITPM